MICPEYSSLIVSTRMCGCEQALTRWCDVEMVVTMCMVKGCYCNVGILNGEKLKFLAPLGIPKTENTCNQPKRLLTITSHRTSTRFIKGSPGVNMHDTNQDNSRTRLQHSKRPPSSPTPITMWVCSLHGRTTPMAGIQHALVFWVFARL